MTALRGWGLPEQHLALDALVAFVDGELTPIAYDRAAAHLADCPSCAADAAAQRQARSAVRKAAPPSMSPQFLQSLQAIPASAELPAQPDGLALTEDGQLVTVNRHDRAAKLYPGTVLGSTTPLGAQPRFSPDDPESTDHPEQSKGHGRRAKQGAGVVFSGLVLGALAFMNLPTDAARNTVTTVPGPTPLGDTSEGGVMPAVTTSTAVTTSAVATGRAAPQHRPVVPPPAVAAPLTGSPSSSAPSTPAQP